MTDYQRVNDFVNHLKEFMTGTKEDKYTTSDGVTTHRTRINPNDLQKGIIDDAMYFAGRYGADVIPQYIREIIVGTGGGRPLEEVEQVEKDMAKLRAVVFTSDMPTIYDEIQPVFDESAATIREMKDAMDKMAGVLNEIQTAQKKEGATLEDIRGILRSQEAREAKQARRDASRHGDAISEKMINLIGNVQKGVTMLLSSSEANVTLPVDKAAEWYGVSVRTIQNWMSGAIKCDDWPGNSAPMSVYREYAARYKAKRRKADGADDGGSWGNGSSILDIGEINNGYSIK